MEGIEFYGKLNFLKGGLLYADLLTTVSKTYSREILTKEYGCGLEGVLQKRSLQLHGIVNGLNCEEWNPATDAALKETYNVQRLMGKAADKEELQCRQGLVKQGTTPLIGMVTRLAQQKGFDLLVDALEDLMKMDLQLVILGTGDAHYQKLLLDLAKDYPHRFRVIIGFEDKLAHQIYAGCDLFLMPSKYEPCGIGQLISLRYGTIPIVRKTGGLADTVTEFNPMTGEGHGFLFEEYSAEALIDAVKRALVFYRNPQHWRRLVLNAMKLDFSWKATAACYIDLYEELRARRQA
jgi:starch synthase